ncbi:ABC-2 type transport system ATP-binding protein [Silvibacterium bohemicum]|uniref:ABC-2 type transport system ATP-binding protein n=1 Tax=Silvibacterium bohemicum TaxID=1577686 RepID=A0A841JNX7_9BACT|nr:ATP-binding cassette domain-containing protein [Silvibacterium bohemicum]MBB6142297.1 ABC-2 type transport system ATP-binding protein [Silvibacterium bohemicum]
MIVEISGLSKVYQDKQQRVTAVDGIDLTVEKGELFGLLGPNGAGKTTTIGICTTRVLPTSGKVTIAGIDVVAHPAAARRNIGVVPQYNTLDRSLTIFENLYFHCKYFGYSGADAQQRSKDLLAQFHLEERGTNFPNQLSGGLQQRVQIARAIAHRPAVLFLDEPSAGLDPQSRIAMWDAVRSLREEGITVVLTTHYMEEADELCERVAIIDHGKVLALDAPAHLKTTLGADTVIELTLRQNDGKQPLIDRLNALPQIRGLEMTSAGLRLFAQGVDGLLPEILQAANNYGVRDIRMNEPNLETVFIRLTGRDLRE